MKIYKLGLFVLIFILFYNNKILAQSKIEFKIGLVRSNVSTEFANTYNSKGGKLLALAVDNPLNKYFSFKSELSYLEYGYSPRENENYQYNYYSVAGLFSFNLNQFNFIPIENLSADILLGPNLLFIMNAEHKTSFSSNIVWRSLIDIGIIFGLHISFHSFLAEINYNKCFTNIIDNSSENYYGSSITNSERNKSWQFLFGYALRLK